MGETVFRLFLSSPGDVAAERARAEAVVEKLNAEFKDRARFDAVFWEDHFYSAHETFQEQIPGRLRISSVTFGNGTTVRTDRVIVAAGAWAESILRPLGVATACSPRVQMLFSVSGPGVSELLDWRPPVRPRDSVEGRTRLPFLILPSGATLKPVFRQRQLWVGCVDTVAHPIGTREDPGRDGRLDYRMAELGERDAFGTDVLPAVTPYLPRFETTAVRLENAWGGYYSFSPDGIPVLTDEAYGVLFVGGDSGSGIMKADSLGRLVAARCEGKSEGRLYTGETYRIDRLSLTHRDVEDEKIIL
jgi:glycine/D-amino acid oxidase-like deaminating enzyme